MKGRESALERDFKLVALAQAPPQLRHVHIWSIESGKHASLTYWWGAAQEWLYLMCLRPLESTQRE